MSLYIPKFNHIWNDTYRINIYWIVCTPEKFRKRYKLEFREEFQGELRGGKQVVAYKDGVHEIIVVWVNPKGHVLSVIVHELFHAVVWAMRNRLIYLDNESCEETYAYLLESLTRKVFDKIRIRKG